MARVSLWCQRACTEVRVGRAATSSDGRFVLRDLPFGDLEIHAEHEAHRPFAMPLPATPEVVLTLQAAAAVAGRVVEAVSGAPVVEFTVGLWSPDGARPMEQEPIKTRSDDGTFLIRNRELEVGAELQVRVQADGHAEASVLAVAAAEPAVDAVVVRLNRGTRVHGVVVDQASGQPLAGVHVVIVERAEYLPARSLQGVVTLADGVFDAGVVVAGIWWLRLSHRERPSELFGPFEVGRGPGHLALRPTMSNGVVVRGRVTGLPGAAGLKIEAYRSGSHTVAATIGADLTFVLTGVGAGRTLLSIQDRERVRWLEIDVGTTDVDGVEFALRAGTGGLRVQVEGFERGRVRVERLTAGRPTGPADLVVLTAGTCVIDGLAAGRYRVVADADGNGRTGEVEVDVGTGEVAVTVRCQQ